MSEDHSDLEERIKELTDDLDCPTFNPTLTPTQVDSNTIHIRAGPWSGPIVTIQDIDEENAITKLVDLVDGETTVREIVEAFSSEQRAEVVEALEELHDKNIVFSRAKHGDDPAYPHLALRNSFRHEDRDRLESKHVLIVTVGQMGIMVAEDLIEMGVSQIGIARPFDTESAEDRVDQPEVTQLTNVELENAIRAADFVVYTANKECPDLTSKINRATHDSKTPWVCGQVLGHEGIVGPAIFPGETACYKCFQNRALANIPNRSGYEAHRNSSSSGERLSDAGLPALSRAIAGYLSLDILHLLSYGIGYTAGRVIRFDSFDLSVEINDVLKLPRCPVCGKEPGNDQARFMELEDLIEADRIVGGD